MSSLYSSSFGLALLYPNTYKKLITLVSGIIATTLAILGIFDIFVVFLSFITIFIPPVGGIYTAEYYLINKEKFSFKYINREDYNKRSILAWLLRSEERRVGKSRDIDG